MDIPIVEEYRIDNMHLTIEDYQDGREGHFFPRLSHKRFHCWVNGGGLPETDTIEEARQVLVNWAVARLNEQVEEHTQRLYESLQAQRLLNGKTANLRKFKG